MSSLEERLAKLERLVEAQQAIIEAKDAEIARLRARVEELERRLGENSSNSSKPPSSDSPAARENRPKDPPSGRRRERVGSDVIVERRIPGPQGNIARRRTSGTSETTVYTHGEGRGNKVPS